MSFRLRYPMRPGSWGIGAVEAAAKNEPDLHSALDRLLLLRRRRRRKGQVTEIDQAAGVYFELAGRINFCRRLEPGKPRLGGHIQVFAKT